MEQILFTLRTAFFDALTHMFVLCGPCVIIGVILFFISRSTRKLFINAGYPKLDIYLTGWIGTPVHEIGHAVFCVLFGHRIVEIRLFSPNSEDGTLGFVHHKFNPKNLYQSAGRFFVGAGPMIFGSVILFLFTFILQEGSFSVLASPVSLFGRDFIPALKDSTLFLTAVYSNLLEMGNWVSWQWYAFLYFSLCVSAHMQLSLSDLRGMLGGGVVLLTVLLFLHLGAVLMGIDLSTGINLLGTMTDAAATLFLFALSLSLFNLLLASMILVPLHYFRYHRILHPF